MAHKIDVTDATFEKEVIQASKKTPVLVDFWASWCGPCVMLKPVLEKLAEQYSGKFILAKVSVEDNQAIAQDFGIMSIPAVKLFKDGEIVDEFIGMMPEAEIRKFLDSNLR